jgi:hypothetical protein
MRSASAIGTGSVERKSNKRLRISSGIRTQNPRRILVSSRVGPHAEGVIHALPPASFATSAEASAATTTSAAISEPLTWAQICERYPDEWVCLAEVDWLDDETGLDFRTARVIGHGKSSGDPIDQAKPWLERYHSFGHLFTGNPRPYISDWDGVDEVHLL